MNLTRSMLRGDMLEILRGMPSKSVDLVMCSPPYEDARLYGELDFRFSGEDWVKWCIPRYLECLRVCRGLVCWVVEGRTRKFRYSATPMILMTELHRLGVNLRKPPLYARNGIPGSGGPDWWRNDYELCVCASHGKLPWSNNLATAEAPKRPPGGAPSHRMQNGERVTKLQTRRKPNGVRVRDGLYTAPEKANPGNIVRGKVGGGLMGHWRAHESEAPYPEWIVEPFVRCFCPPGGVVLDPFGGSGTTAVVAEQNTRGWIYIEKRHDQVNNARMRMLEECGVDMHTPRYAEWRRRVCSAG